MAAKTLPLVTARRLLSGCRPAQLLALRPAPASRCVALLAARALSSTRVVGNKWAAINDDIEARVVQLVGDDGKMRADVPLRRALEEARAKGVDLVQVSANGSAVVCRMFDAKKRAFSMKKAQKQQKPKQDKEVLFSVKIAPHDMQVKVNQVTKFLGKGHKVKVTVKFGNQFHLKDEASNQLAAIIEAIGPEAGTPDAEPRLQFGGVYSFIAPAK